MMECADRSARRLRRIEYSVKLNRNNVMGVQMGGQRPTTSLTREQPLATPALPGNNTRGQRALSETRTRYLLHASKQSGKISQSLTFCLVATELRELGRGSKRMTCGGRWGVKAHLQQIAHMRPRQEGLGFPFWAPRGRFSASGGGPRSR
ncbi:hypothetical protein BX600DRAFT_272915 [Xylariales sp. PMI_506]|nr:hypothetical protein BX600DRAFT_272915 [Xylariales sp. PMI_506]